jgi:hypothetical protein
MVTDCRSPVGLAALTGGGWLFGDRKSGKVTEVDARGVTVVSWEVAGLQGLAASPQGPRFAAAGDSIYRLLPGGGIESLAVVAEYAPLAALAADGAGTLFLVDRRGQRIGRLDPGEPAPRTLHEDPEARFVALAWDGRGVAALDARTPSVVRLDREGTVRQRLEGPAGKPVALAADPTGRIAVLDAKAKAVYCTEPDGREWEDPAVVIEEAAKPTWVAYAADGALAWFDGTDSTVVVRP